MKTRFRILSVLMCVVMLATSLPWTAFAEEASASTDPVQETPIDDGVIAPETDYVFIEPGSLGDEPIGDIIITEDNFGLKLNPDEKSYTLVASYNTDPELVIPGEYNGLPITRIGEYAFLNNKTATSIILPESIERVEEGAFDGLSENFEWNTDDNGKYIGSTENKYFYFYSPKVAEDSIESATVNEMTKIVASYAFRNRKALLSLTLPAGVKQVGYGALFGCTNIESLTLPFVGETGGKNNAMFGWIFGARTFGGNISYVPLSLYKVEILGGDMHKNSLYGLDGITTLTLPKMTDHLGYYYGAATYSDNINYVPGTLTSVTVFSGEIPSYAFYNCVRISNVKIGDNVTLIHNYAFYGCTSLRNATIGNGVTFIGWDVFYNCTSLISLTIPFVGSTKNGTNDKYFGYLFGANSCSDNGSYVPESLKTVIITGGSSIGYGAFYDCSSITSITLPDSVTSIDAYAFYNTVYYNNSNNWVDGVLYIGNHLIQANSSISGDYSIKEGTLCIANYAFADCTSLTSVTIPDSIKSIGKYAFSSCTSLTRITIPFVGATKDGTSNTHFGYLFGASDSASNANYVPKSIKTVIITGGSSICEYAFRDCASLTNVTIGNSVTSIGYMAFNNCASLTSITIPDSVKLIDSYVFENCTSLTSITIPDSVESIGSFAFKNTAYYNNSGNWTDGVLYIGNHLVATQNFSKTTYTVKEGTICIAGHAFAGCTSLTSITIPNGVKSIGLSAFNNCTSLTDITIPDSVVSIGSYAFNNCTSLTSITIPNSVTSIRSYAFSGCTSLTDITIPDSVVSIGSSAFNNTAYYKNSENWTDGVLYIGNHLIYARNYSKTTYTIKEGTVCIAEDAFYNCISLTSITMPGSVKSIGSYAFSGCTSLVSIYFDGSYSLWSKIALGSYWNNNTGEYTIYCSDATVSKAGEVTYLADMTSNISATNTDSYVQLSASVPEIEETPVPVSTMTADPLFATPVSTISEVENYSEGLRYVSNGDGTCYVSGIGSCSDTDIVIPSVSPSGDSVTSIGYNAFNRRTSLTSITIPDSVMSIGDYAFYNCTSLTSITIPDSVVSIGYNAFYNCTSLTRVTIPNSVTSIGSYTFCGCTKLTSVTIGNGVTSIGEGAFYGCTSLTNVTIGNNVTSIDSDAFSDCSSLTSITIPDSVTSIGSRAFENCTSLTNITIPDSITSIGAYAFNNTAYYNNSENRTDGVLYIGNHLIHSRSDSKTTYTIKEGTLCIAESAFTHCTLLTSITIPNSVTSIGEGAFNSCTSLISVTIPDSVTSIGSYAFYNCTSLTSIKIGNGVTSIGYSAFENCTSLTSVTIPGSVTSIDAEAFYNCTSLASVTIGNGVTSIYYSAFYGCTALTSITIPDSVTSIGYTAFYNCTSLTSVTIGNSVTSIGSNAFKDCIEITAVHISDLAAWCCIDFGDSFANPVYYSKELYLNGTLILDLIIPEGITSIGSYTFSYCKSLTSVTIPNSVKTISSNAFSGCTSLTSVKIGNGVTQVGSTVFAGCSESLEEITYDGEHNEWRYVRKASDWNVNGDIVYTIKYGKNSGVLMDTSDDFSEFYISGYLYDPESENAGVVNLKKGYSGRPVVAVLSNAFYNNRDIEKIFLPEGLTYIGKHAFANCTSLVEISFPKSLQSIEFGALMGCVSLTDLTLPFIGSDRDTEENCYLGYIYGASAYNVKAIPETLVSVTVTDAHRIGKYAFYNCANLKSVTLNEGIVSIEDLAFYGCAGLTELVIPDSVTSVGTEILKNCYGVKVITIGASLTKAGLGDIWAGNPLFGIDKSGSSLQKYIVSKENPSLRTDDDHIKGCPENCAQTHDHTEACPGICTQIHDHIKGCPENCTQTHGFGVLYSVINLTDGDPVKVEVIDVPANADLTGYVLPELIVKICPYAFAYNNTLRHIAPKYVRHIANNAFYKCENLGTVDFGVVGKVPSEVSEADDLQYSQYICEEAFMGCSSLVNINLESATIIGIEDAAFADCDSLTTVTLGENIAELGIGVFGTGGSGGSSLQRINVNDENPYFLDTDGVLYGINDDRTLTLMIYPAMAEASKDNGSETNEPETNESETKTIFEVPATITVEKGTEDNKETVTFTVTGIESEAFRMSRNLNELIIKPSAELKIGNYAFANSRIERITIGKNVVSLGLKRGESEYTVFADCAYLTSIEVEDGNAYYRSVDGVLFDKEQTKLFKYPTAKTDILYELPETVTFISSLAFKDNSDIKYVHIRSEVETIGFEAFYGCGNLSLIFFDGVYAPKSVMENAFTTFDSINENHKSNPRTKIGYSTDYYENGSDGYGWVNYEGIYDIVTWTSIPDYKRQPTDEFYAIVVVDSAGVRVNDVRITLTDPSGTTETVETGSKGAETGVAVFYDLFSAVGTGFDLSYGNAYSMKVADLKGEYFTFTNPSFYLDEEMRITYVTLTKKPSVYGLTCDETDINTETAELNKKQYGTNVPAFMANMSAEEIFNADISWADIFGKIFNEENLVWVSDHIDITVSAYCDTLDGWTYFDENGKLINHENSGLYQNGVPVGEITDISIEEDHIVITIDVEVFSLLNEIPIEARFTAKNPNKNEIYTCSSLLNIHVFDFLITSDNINMDTTNVDAALSTGNPMLDTLMGGSELNISIGENIEFITAVDGNEVELTAKYKDKIYETPSYSNAQKGYENNNSKTYRFIYNGLVEIDGHLRSLRYVISLARDTEERGYCYYRCNVHLESSKGEKIATFYGIVNQSKLSKSPTTKGKYSNKALLIYFMHYLHARQYGDLDAMKQMDHNGARYSEALPDTKPSSKKFSVEWAISGTFKFIYDREKGIQPVEKRVKAEVFVKFQHNQQFFVWGIPFILEIEIKAGAGATVTWKLDDDKKSLLPDEFIIEVFAMLEAKFGLGCKVVSGGVYGGVGITFIFEFLPEMHGYVEFSGEIGLYAKVAVYEKKWTLFKDSNKIQLYQATYLADTYGLEDLDTCEGSGRIVLIGDKLYRIAYVDVGSADGYDEYNYRKLAVEKWTGSDWTDRVLIDDNGLNDLDYNIYSDGKDAYIIYTQQTKKLDAEMANDAYAVASDVIVKVAKVSDTDDIELSAVTESGCYKYLPELCLIDGRLTAVWAENADNNMFGVSPYNYVDEENDESYVFATTANSLLTSTLSGDVWSAPQQAASGLSTVTDLAVNESGHICYIIDTNGDLADNDDRVMYSFDFEADASEAFNDVADSSIVMVDSNNGGFVYYIYPTSEEETAGIRYMAMDGNTAVELPREIANLTDKYKVVSDPSGNAGAVIYPALKTWTEAGETVSGSALYAVFCNDGEWGSPVEISAFPAESEAYISSFDAMYTDDTTLLLIAEFVNKEGAVLYSLTKPKYLLAPELTVEGYTINYRERSISVTLKNNGAVSTAVYMSVEGGEREMICEKLISGASETIEISLYGCDSMTPAVAFYENPTDAAAVTLTDIDLNYSDIIPYSKQLLLGKNNTLLVAIKNTGNLDNSGYVFVRPGNYNTETIGAEELIALVGGSELALNTPKEALDANGDPFWVIRFEGAANTIQYVEVPIDGTAFTKDEGLISICAVTDLVTEKGDAADNNNCYISYKGYTGVLEEGEDASVPAQLQANDVEFDILNARDIVISFTGGSDDNVASLILNGNALTAAKDYDSKNDDGFGSINVYATALSGKLLKGNNTLDVVFLDGSTGSVTIKVPEYHEVTWMSDGEVLAKTDVKNGTIPSIDLVPVKESTLTESFEFVGWGSSADSSTTGCVAVYSPVTYYAVWRSTEITYPVTWRFMDSTGSVVEIIQNYSYGETPSYGGARYPAPAKMEFSCWDKEMTPVTEASVYTAVYVMGDCGSMTLTSDEVNVLAGSEFELTVKALMISGVGETELKIMYDSSVASILGITTREGVELAEIADGCVTFKLALPRDAVDAELVTLRLLALKDPAQMTNNLLDAECDATLTKLFGAVKIINKGDINLDGDITAADITTLARHLAKVGIITDEIALGAADTTGDGAVSAADLTMLARYIAKIIDSFD